MNSLSCVDAQMQLKPFKCNMLQFSEFIPKFHLSEVHMTKVWNHLIVPLLTNKTVSHVCWQANLASNGAQNRFDGRVQQPLVRWFQEGREEEKLRETSELKLSDALAWRDRSLVVFDPADQLTPGTAPHAKRERPCRRSAERRRQSPGPQPSAGHVRLRGASHG